MSTTGKSKTAKKFLQRRVHSESWSFSSQRKGDLGIAAKHTAGYVCDEKVNSGSSSNCTFVSWNCSLIVFSLKTCTPSMPIAKSQLPDIIWSGHLLPPQTSKKASRGHGQEVRLCLLQMVIFVFCNSLLIIYSLKKCTPKAASQFPDIIWSLHPPHLTNDNSQEGWWKWGIIAPGFHFLNVVLQ